jgi:uracil-DNA glycosylase
MTWDDLEYWRSDAWRKVEEKLDELDKHGTLLCPRRELLFNALDHVCLERVRVAIVGQDPYPDIADATGIAFSIPGNLTVFPYTLGVILREYQHDLHYPIPSSGDLTEWSKRENVLLWNAIPSTVHGQSLAHYSWTEWQSLTEEIVRTLDSRGVVLAFLGRVAQEYARFATSGNSKVIRRAHPAAERYRGSKGGHNLFSGSRFFTTINDSLVSLGQKPVNWRLT